MVFFCRNCNQYRPNVIMPQFQCRNCYSFFVEEIDPSQVPLQEQVNRGSNRFQAPPLGMRQQRQHIPMPYPPPPIRRPAAMQIPLQIPPVRRQPVRQLYVTPEGRIVNEPYRPGVPSEDEVIRRRSALVIRPYNAEDDKDDECPICIDHHSGTVAMVQGCKHYFHVACMHRWLEQKNSCPLCQTVVAN